MGFYVLVQPEEDAEACARRTRPGTPGAHHQLRWLSDHGADAGSAGRTTARDQLRSSTIGDAARLFADRLGGSLGGLRRGSTSRSWLPNTAPRRTKWREDGGRQTAMPFSMTNRGSARAAPVARSRLAARRDQSSG